MSSKVQSICSENSCFRRRNNIFLLLFFSLLLSFPAYADSDYSLRIADDLSFEMSGGILRDSDGILWIGTQNGVIRWLGESIVRYSPQNSNLNGNFVTGLIESEDGRIWILTSDGGLSYFDKQSNRMITARNPENPDVLSGGSWLGNQSLVETDHHGIVIASSFDLIAYKDGRFSTLTIKNKTDFVARSP